MSKIIEPTSSEARVAVAALFDQSAPVLVEVRFPGMGTSSDWHLLDDEEQLESILEPLGHGVEVHLSSVWNLRNPKGTLSLKK